MKTDLRERIKNFPSLLKTYETALKFARENDLKGDALDYFLSKNCRVYFFEAHLKVEKELPDQAVRSVQDSPIVSFSLSKTQLILLDAFEKRMMANMKFRVRVMKCRRAKVSTIYLALAYHLVRFNENKKGLVFSDRLETSRKLKRILDIFYLGDNLPMKPDSGKKTLGEGMYFHDPTMDKNITDRDSFILLGSGEQKNSGIGGSLDFMVWSEAALTADAMRHWTTISPSLQGALFDVAESTPSMTGQDEIIFPEFEKSSEACDKFFISWMDIEEYRVDDKEKAAAFAPYPDHHLYGKEVEIMADWQPTVPQMLWRRFKLDEIRNLNAFKQVFPISQDEAFFSGAGLFFHRSLIDATKPKDSIAGKHCFVSDQTGMNVAMVQDDAGAWTIYKEPLFQNYMVTVDTAEGKASDRDGRDADYSVAMVFSMSYPIEEVAIVRDRIPPEVMAEQVASVARYYRDAIVIPERNSVGLAFIVRLMQVYSNIYRQQKLQQGVFNITEEFGFQTTSTSKAYALSCLLSIMRNKGDLILHTEQARHELSKFCQQGVKYCAMSGHHDDIISCLWLMAVGVSQMPSLLTRGGSDGSLSDKPRYICKPILRTNEFNYAK